VDGGPGGFGTVYRLSGPNRKTFTLLHAFSGPAAGPGDGASPTALAMDAAGNLWGTARTGGANGNGLIFKITPAGVYSVVHTFPTTTLKKVTYPTFGGTGFLTFDVNAEGTWPSALTLGHDGNLYGLCEGGGTNGTGTAFRITPDGAFSAIHHFSVFQLRPGAALGTATPVDFLNNDGAAPTDAPLVVAADGSLYGVTSQGGPNGLGTYFRLTTGGVFTRVYDTGNTYVFQQDLGGTSSTMEGIAPMSLTPAPDGSVLVTYGESFSHTSAAVDSRIGGTIQRILPGGAGVTTLYTFGDTTYLYFSPQSPSQETLLHGYWPSSLAIGPDGTIYGTSMLGGPNGNGILFKLAPDASSPTGVSPKILYGPVTDGSLPKHLLFGLDGNLYGTGAGGAQTNDGVVFEASPTTLPFLLHSFNGADGNNPIAVTLGTDGRVYGLTYGSTDGVGAGRFFSLTTTSTPENDTTQILNKFTNFARANNDLFQANDGKFYATVSESIGSNGSILQLSAGGLVQSIYDLIGPSVGGNPLGNVTDGKDGFFYGSTRNYAPLGGGAVYRYNRTTGQVDLIHAFDPHGPEGDTGVGSLLLASDGRLYGVCARDGETFNNGLGTIYSFNPKAPAPNYDFKVVHQFTAATGGNSPGGLVERASDGVLFGVIGVNYYTPNIFRVNKDGTGFSIVESAGTGQIRSPLVLAPDGGLYGMADGNGGDITAMNGSWGTIFRVDPDTGTVGFIHRFHMIDGIVEQYQSNYQARLVLGPDGNLYGAAPGGGVNTFFAGPSIFTENQSFGTIFRLVINPPTSSSVPHAKDVTGQFTVQYVSHTFVGGIHRYAISLTNKGAAVTGPIEAAFDNLGVAQALTADGYTHFATPAGSPFMQASSSSIAAGGKVSLVLQTTKPLPATVQVRVLAAPGAL